MDDNYVYMGVCLRKKPNWTDNGNDNGLPNYPPDGSIWFAIRRLWRGDGNHQALSPAPFSNGHGWYEDVLVVHEVPVSYTEDLFQESRSAVQGIVAGASGDQLIVSIPVGGVEYPGSGYVYVYDKTALDRDARVRTLSLDFAPGGIAMQPGAEALWIVDESNNKIRKLDLQTGATTAEIAVPNWAPVAVSVTTDGRVVVGDDGPAKQIRLFDAAGLAQVDQIGTGGIYAGERGLGGAGRFFGIVGVGNDNDGDIYVGMDYFGGRIEKYRKTANGWTRLWADNGPEFVHTAGFDPADDGNVYTPNHRYRIDYSLPPGSNLEAWTADPERYPDDPRVAFYGRRSGQYGTSATMRRLGPENNLFMFAVSAPGIMTLYRFEGEIAVPCVVIAARGDKMENDLGRPYPPNYPSENAWIWTDKNCDGQFDADEYESFDHALDNSFSMRQIDQEGTIWYAQFAPNDILSFHIAGYDGNGIPRYTFIEPHLVRYPLPPAADITWLARAFYSSETDSMYLGACTSTHPKPPSQTDSRYSRMPVLMRFDNWSSSPELAWSIEPPCDLDSPWSYKYRVPCNISVAGDHLFLGYSFSDDPTKGAPYMYRSTIRTYAAQTGNYLGTIAATEDIGYIGGDQDRYDCMHAHVRSNGEYLIVKQDFDMARNILYRWSPEKPSGLLGFTTAALSAQEDVGSITLTITRSGGKAGAAQVDYSTRANSASADDYGPITGTLHWADGDAESKSLVLSINDDNTNEADERFSLILSNPGPDSGLATDSITITIVDNDLPATETGSPSPPSGSDNGCGTAEDSGILSCLPLLILLCSASRIRRILGGGGKRRLGTRKSHPPLPGSHHPSTRPRNSGEHGHPQTLHAAQESPGDVLVRKAGFTARFVLFGGAEQDDIIERFEHEI